MQRDREHRPSPERPVEPTEPVERFPGLRGQEAIDTDSPPAVEPLGPDGPEAAPRPTQLNPRP